VLKICGKKGGLTDLVQDVTLNQKVHKERTKNKGWKIIEEILFFRTQVSMLKEPTVSRKINGMVHMEHRL
jgi:hypothetical protein